MPDTKQVYLSDDERKLAHELLAEEERDVLPSEPEEGESLADRVDEWLDAEAEAAAELAGKAPEPEDDRPEVEKPWDPLDEMLAFYAYRARESHQRYVDCVRANDLAAAASWEQLLREAKHEELKIRAHQAERKKAEADTDIGDGSPLARAIARVAALVGEAKPCDCPTCVAQRAAGLDN